MSHTTVVHDSQEWHALRSRHVGGSEVAALFGVQPDYALSKYALWHVKKGTVPPPHIDNPRTRWGLRLEQAIAEAASEQEGWDIKKGGYVSDDTTPGLGCTLDYVVLFDPTENGHGALELKNTDWLAHRRTWTDGEPPAHVLLQLQHQLASTGYSWGAVACLVGGNDLRLYRYKARPKLIAEIRQRVRDFWASIDAGREPPVDGSDSASAVLRALYATVDDETVDLTDDNELPEICAGYLAAADKRLVAEKEEAEYKNRLIAKVQSHRSVMVQGYTIRVSVTPEKPDRPAEPGEIIRGRKESRRYTVKEASP